MNSYGATMKTASKILAVNSISALFQQIVYMAKGFIVPLAMIHFYGSDINGLVSSVSQFIGYFTLIGAGLASSVMFHLFAPLANKEYERINTVLSTSRRIYNRLGLVFLGLVAGGAFVYPFILRQNNFPYLFIVCVFLVTGVGISLEMFSLRRWGALLQADNRSWVLNLTLCVHAVIQSVAVLVLGSMGLSVLFVLAAVAGSYFVRSLILTVVCRRRYRFLNFNLPSDNSLSQMRRAAFVQQVCDSIAAGIPLVMVSVLLPMAQVSVLAVYLLVVDALSRVLNATGSVWHLWGGMWAKGQTGRLCRSFTQFDAIYMLCVTVFTAVMSAAVLPFITVYTGRLPDAVMYLDPALAIICAIHLFTSAQIPNLVRLINAAGLYSSTAKYAVARMLLAVALAVVLGRVWASAGIMLGVVLANVCYCGMLLYSVPGQCGLRARWVVIRRIAGGGLAVCMGVLLRVLVRYPHTWGYVCWCASTVLCVLICTPLVLLGFVLMEPSVYKELWTARVLPLVRRIMRKEP